jgi:D-sedoheptulose 7-phosphate isomerase
MIKETIKCLNDIKEVETQKLYNLVANKQKIIIIGNGGSNSISSHISQDYTKFLKKQSFCFSDPSRLTCYINDYGMENAYKIFLENFADEKTLCILISSSGESQNILNCCAYCLENNIDFVILTGFSLNNKVKTKYENYSKLSLYVESNSYGVVECVHQIFLHSII